jgi:hypothetical protein
MTVFISTLDPETVEIMYRTECTALLDMINHGWLSASVMQTVFDVARQNRSFMLCAAKMCMSHPQADVRAVAASELLAFVDVDELSKSYLWR